jgi:hypothetical protein
MIFIRRKFLRVSTFCDRTGVVLVKTVACVSLCLFFPFFPQVATTLGSDASDANSNIRLLTVGMTSYKRAKNLLCGS